MGSIKENYEMMFTSYPDLVDITQLKEMLGIGITLVLLVPGNALIHSLTGSTLVNASLPISAAIILIVLSIVLTLTGGIIPSRKAAKLDPVKALRTD